MRHNFLIADGVETCLRFGSVEDLIVSHTEIEPVEHEMCPNSCFAITSPFEDLEQCPTCDISRWNELKLHASHRCVKVTNKTFITFPLGSQLCQIWSTRHKSGGGPKGRRELKYEGWTGGPMEVNGEGT